MRISDWSSDVCSSDLLRERGVMILASGNVVHNLRRIQWDNPDGGEAWAHRFDDAVADVMAERPGDLPKAAEHTDFALAVTTPDHFLPLLSNAGPAAASGGGGKDLVRGHAIIVEERHVGVVGASMCRPSVWEYNQTQQNDK